MLSSPDDGMSAGIGLMFDTGWAAASGAKTRLKRKPVTLEKTKRKRIAKAANFRERNRGNFRDNFIQYLLRVNNDHKGLGFLTSRRHLWGLAPASSSDLEAALTTVDSDGPNTTSVALL